MDNLLDASRFKANIVIVMWFLTLLSAVSCLIRTDFNIVLGFVTIGLMNRYHDDNPKYLTKIVFQLLVLMSAFEVIFLVILTPYWTYKLPGNEYWSSLSTGHTVTLILTCVELTIKILLAVIYYMHYKKYFPEEVSDLFNLDYANPITSSI